MPLVGFPRAVGVPPVSLARWSGSEVRAAATTMGTHAHDFLVLFWVERGAGPMRVDGRDWHLGPGDAFLVAPGAAVAPPDPRLDPDAVAWALFFPTDAVGTSRDVDVAAVGPVASWRTHPLLASFAVGSRTGARRLPVPPDDRPAWGARFAALAEELEVRRDGQAEAVRAHLTLLLVELARLDVDVAGALADDPLLAAVFDVVERRHDEPMLSLSTVARAVALTPGHVATVVSERTGRSVGEWITERRMRAARRLLVDTDLSVARIAGLTGYADPGYFARRFRREHGVPPGAWRRTDPAPPAPEDS